MLCLWQTDRWTDRQRWTDIITLCIAPVHWSSDCLMCWECSGRVLWMFIVLWESLLTGLWRRLDVHWTESCNKARFVWFCLVVIQPRSITTAHCCVRCLCPLHIKRRLSVRTQGICQLHVLSVMQLRQFGTISHRHVLLIYSWTFVYCYELTFTDLVLLNLVACPPGPQFVILCWYWPVVKNI